MGKRLFTKLLVWLATLTMCLNSWAIETPVSYSNDSGQIMMAASKKQHTEDTDEDEDDNCQEGDCEEGYGVYQWPNRDKYEGNFKNGKANGQGTCYFADGRKYVGNWKNGKRDGQGTFTRSDGRKYVGNWKNDKFEGQGTFTWTNGDKYVGYFKENQFDGQGAYTWPSGKKQEGIWKESKFTGPIITWKTPHDATNRVSTADFRIAACIKAAQPLTAEVQVNVNGIEQAMRRLDPVPSGDCDVTVERIVRLSSGDNVVKLFAVNDNGQTTSAKKIITYQPNLSASTPEKRLALVIGNSRYQRGALLNPANDAQAMGKTLSELGFEVVTRTDLTKDKMKQAILDFSQRVAETKSGVNLFYYSGHGAQLKGENYLIPVDAEMKMEEKISIETISLSEVMAEMPDNRANIIILDACRDNPYPRRTRSGASQGLTAPQKDVPMGTYIAFATQPGSVADDNPDGKNGLYTNELLGAMKTPGLSIENVFKRVRAKVFEKSNRAQVPWENSSLVGDFYFVPPTK